MKVATIEPAAVRTLATESTAGDIGLSGAVWGSVTSVVAVALHDGSNAAAMGHTMIVLSLVSWTWTCLTRALDAADATHQQVQPATVLPVLDA